MDCGVVAGRVDGLAEWIRMWGWGQRGEVGGGGGAQGGTKHSTPLPFASIGPHRPSLRQTTSLGKIHHLVLALLSDDAPLSCWVFIIYSAEVCSSWPTLSGDPRILLLGLFSAHYWSVTIRGKVFAMGSLHLNISLICSSIWGGASATWQDIMQRGHAALSRKKLVIVTIDREPVSHHNHRT